MRMLKKNNHIIMVCKVPIHTVIHPDCYDELVTFVFHEQDKLIHWLKVRTANTPKPVPWTSHLDPPAEVVLQLTEGGFIYESVPRKGPGYPTSATREFLHKVARLPENPNPHQLLMCANPPERKSSGEYDVLVSMGSAEKMRRFNENDAVDLCNALVKAGLKVVLHANSRPANNLHSKVGCALNRHNEGTMEQLKELVWGSRLIMGPDSGTNHLALAYGKPVVFFESREHFAGVVDIVYVGSAHRWVKENPRCALNCHARRRIFDEWPKAPAQLTGPTYPHALECAQEPSIPCLRLSAKEIVGIIELPIVQDILDSL